MSHWFSSLGYARLRKDYPEPEKSTIRGQIEKASVNRPYIPSTHIFSQLACLPYLFIQAVRWSHLSQVTFRWGWEQSKQEINIGTIPKHDVLHNQAFREQLETTFYDFDINSEKIAPTWSSTDLLSPLQHFLIMMIIVMK